MQLQGGRFRRGDVVEAAGKIEITDRESFPGLFHPRERSPDACRQFEKFWNADSDPPRQ